MDVSYRIEQKRKVNGAFPGPKSQELTARRQKSVAAGVASTLPVYAADVDGGIIVDVDGNQLIDLGSGIAVTTVGASNQAVAKAVAEQAARFTHTCFMVAPYENYIELAEKLVAITPGEFEKRAVFFNSGAEAVENAIKVARVATGRQAVVAFDHAYHGRTNLTMGLTAKAAPYKRGFGPLAPEIYRMPMSYPYREENPNISGKEAAERAILAMEKQIGGDQIAAIIIEPIQGEGGFIVPATGFLPRVAEWAKENGIVFIADEVQAGFARSGAWFASDIEGIEPDLVTVAKASPGACRCPVWWAAPNCWTPCTAVDWAAPTAATRSPWPRPWRASSSWTSRTCPAVPAKSNPSSSSASPRCRRMSRPWVTCAAAGPWWPSNSSSRAARSRTRS